MGVAASMVAKAASIGSDWAMAALHRAWSPGSLQDVFRPCITDNPARWFIATGAMIGSCGPDMIDKLRPHLDN